MYCTEVWDHFVPNPEKTLTTGPSEYFPATLWSHPGRMHKSEEVEESTVSSESLSSLRRAHSQRRDAYTLVLWGDAIFMKF